MTLLINISEDYADEFDYPVISFFSSALKNYLLLKGLHYLTEDDLEFYFGTNEALRFDLDQIKSLISGATELDAEEIHYAKRYLTPVPGLDIIERIIDIIYDRIQETDPDEAANFDAIVRNQG